MRAVDLSGLFGIYPTWAIQWFAGNVNAALLLSAAFFVYAIVSVIYSLLRNALPKLIHYGCIVPMFATVIFINVMPFMSLAFKDVFWTYGIVLVWMTVVEVVFTVCVDVESCFLRRTIAKISSSIPLRSSQETIARSLKRLTRAQIVWHILIGLAVGFQMQATAATLTTNTPPIQANPSSFALKDGIFLWIQQFGTGFVLWYSWMSLPAEQKPRKISGYETSQSASPQLPGTPGPGDGPTPGCGTPVGLPPRSILPFNEALKDALKSHATIAESQHSLVFSDTVTGTVAQSALDGVTTRATSAVFLQSRRSSCT